MNYLTEKTASNSLMIFVVINLSCTNIQFVVLSTGKEKRFSKRYYILIGPMSQIDELK